MVSIFVLCAFRKHQYIKLYICCQVCLLIIFRALALFCIRTKPTVTRISVRSLVCNIYPICRRGPGGMKPGGWVNQRNTILQ